MRDAVIAIVAACVLTVIWFCVMAALVNPGCVHDAQLKNPYWPFSVELRVSDR